jgi:hypothetical protein
VAQRCKQILTLLFLLFYILLLLPGFCASSHVSAAPTLEEAFTSAAQEFGVPAPLLKALCYMEGRLSNHGGSPSIDNGYGCMHLVSNRNAHTLEQAAQALRISETQLKQDIITNIRGGALILREYALQRSPTRTLPLTLPTWYDAIAAYSNATTRHNALMYADGVYRVLNSGFSIQAENGEIITLAPQAVKPERTQALSIRGTSALPAGCVDDGKVDYPDAINCIVDPKYFDCNRVPDDAPCTYEGAQRPREYSISQVVIHNIEGSTQDGLNVFHNVNSNVSMHYIVDTDGTVYQLLHDEDIAYHAGNYWNNQHTIGIEHAGYAATGWQWYNATQYLASAKLAAYLIKKYNIPLDHDHIVAHGTIPAPTLALTPNHVDPGPYWLWDYYFRLIHQQDISYPPRKMQENIVTLRPPSSKRPLGEDGHETKENFNYFYLHTGPSTDSPLLKPAGNGKDILDETNNVEPLMHYYFMNKVKDPAGTGFTLYEIWYGAEDQSGSSSSRHFAHAIRAWLAVPPGSAVDGRGTLVRMRDKAVPVSGKPESGSTYYIGDAPANATFVSGYSIQDDETDNIWYAITYNHRYAWIPASTVTVIHSPD